MGAVHSRTRALRLLVVPAAAASVAADVDADDAVDFKLPSMFRPASPQISDNASVAPTRLTDALKIASGAIDSDSRSNGSLLDVGAYAALSSLKSQSRIDVTPLSAALPSALLPAATTTSEPSRVANVTALFSKEINSSAPVRCD